MKYILQIVDNISVDSGVSSVIMNTYRNIDKTKIQFDFLVCKNDRTRGDSYEEEIRQYGGQVFYFGFPLSVKGVFYSNRNARLFLKKHADKYYAVHLHTPTIAFFTLRHACKYNIKHRIVHSHSTMTSKNIIKVWLNRVLVGCIPFYANNYWTCSTQAAEFLYGKRFCQTHAVEWIRNAVNPIVFFYSEQKRYEARQQLGLNKETVFIHISNFSPIKNHDFLIPIIQKVQQKKPGSVFVFVGDGPTKEAFEARLHANGLMDVCVFTGRKKDVSGVLCAADALLLPSIKEGLPVTVLEAQASGLPCFISEAVTKECNVSDVVYLPLAEDLWVDLLLQLEPISCEERLERSKAFCKSSFNIQIEAKNIEAKYENLLN